MTASREIQEKGNKTYESDRAILTSDPIHMRQWVKKYYWGVFSKSEPSENASFG